jgi:hypothetical protein
MSGPNTLSYFDASWGDFQVPHDAAAVHQAIVSAGAQDSPVITALLKMLADRDLALETFMRGVNIPNVEQDVPMWTQTGGATSTDVSSWQVAQGHSFDAWPFGTLQQPFVSVGVVTRDASIAWDLTLGVYTAPNAGGTNLGNWGMRNDSGVTIVQAQILCDEYYVDPDTLQTYYLHAQFTTASPTLGMQAETAGRCDRWARTRIRRYMGPLSIG